MNYKKKIILSVSFLLFAIGSIVFLAFFKKSSKPKKDYIVCTTSIIYDALINILPSEIEVKSLMGPEIDPHLYKPRISDMFTLEYASIIFYNGLHLEGKMADILEQLKESGKSTYAISDTLEESDLRNTEYAGIHDPHIWFDVLIWIKVVSFLKDVLSNHYKEYADEIIEKSDVYIEKLKKLDTWVVEKINSVDSRKRILITAHDAFGYFGKRYDIQVEALQGISTDAEICIADMERLITLILKNKLPVLFIEQTVPEKYLKGIIEQLKPYNHTIRIGGSLYSDALGEENSPGEDYISMIKYNVETIVSELNKDNE